MIYNGLMYSYVVVDQHMASYCFGTKLTNMIHVGFLKSHLA